MKKHLYRFGYESPVEKRTNLEQDIDSESSEAVFIRADSVDDALLWGRHISQVFVARLHEPTHEDWMAGDFANWIEDSPDPTWDLNVVPVVTSGDEEALQTLVADWLKRDK